MSGQIVSPMGQINAACALLGAASLGLTSGNFAGLNTTILATPFQVPVPLVVRVIFTLTSGTLTVNAQVGASSTYSAYTSTTGAVSATTEQVLTVSTSGYGQYVCLQLVGSSAVISEFGVEVIGKMPYVQTNSEINQWSATTDLPSAFNALASSRQAPNGGLFTFTATD